MSIKCGNCKNSHETVAEVRDCHITRAVAPGTRRTDFPKDISSRAVDGQGWPVRSARTAASPASPAQVEGVNWATVISDIRFEVQYHSLYAPVGSEKQVDFANSLLVRREHGLHDFLAAQGNQDQFIRSLPRKAISILIGALTKAPVKSGKEFVPSVVREEVPVPAGRYAITGADGETKFYKVDRPTEGRWAGYVFVKIQAGSEYHKVPAQRAILAKIAEDGPEVAMLRYGRELGHCGHCGRELTNDESRKVGIGPVCRSKVSF